MMDAYDVISKVWNSNKDIPDLRTAAMMVAVQRVAQSYSSLGI
jgi:glutamate dehydrogenase (NAD(P)+)